MLVYGCMLHVSQHYLMFTIVGVTCGSIVGEADPCRFYHVHAHYHQLNMQPFPPPVFDCLPYANMEGEGSYVR